MRGDSIGGESSEHSIPSDIVGALRGVPVRWSEPMSALPSPSSGQPVSNEAVADPSMEEILASIRRIIADDHGTPITPRPSRVAAPTPIAMAAPAARPDFPRPRPGPETIAIQPRPHDLQPSSEPEAILEAIPLRETIQPTESPIIDRVAQLEAAPARVRSMLRNPVPETAQPQAEQPVEQSAVAAPIAETPAPMEQAAPRGDSLLSPLARASVTSAFEALTVSMAVQNSSLVEDAVRDMLQPMLKQWLDDNLPTIVERLVRAEIERVARGGRS